MGIITNIPKHDPLYCIYFYYLQYPQGESQDEGPSMRVYYDFDKHYPIENDVELIKRIRILALNARAEDFVPPPCGDKFSSVPWRRKSYIVILLDHPSHNFPNTEALNIDFLGHVEEFNHSFFNARKLDIDLPGGTVTALCCVNLMQHKDGRNLRDPEREYYQVDVSPDSVQMRRIDGDDGGTNQGGPVPPPSPM